MLRVGILCGAALAARPAAVLLALRGLSFPVHYCVFHAVLHTGSNEPTCSSEHFLHFFSCQDLDDTFLHLDNCPVTFCEALYGGGCRDRINLRVKPCGGSACRCGRCGAALALNYCAALGDRDRLRRTLPRSLRLCTGLARRGYNFTSRPLRLAAGAFALFGAYSLPLRQELRRSGLRTQ